MIRTMLWKEYREHRIIWLAMLVVNCGALFGMWYLEDSGMLGMGQSSSRLLTLAPVAALLVWGYGMICGGMLLAGEREERTLSFLDTLPVTRFRLWLAKAQIGVLLLGGQVLALWVLLAVLHSMESPTLLNGKMVSQSIWFSLWAIPLSGLIGIAYGLFFSARGENVLSVIGLTILGQALAGFAAAFLVLAGLFLLQVALVFGFGVRHNGGFPEAVYNALIPLTFCGLTLAVVAGSALSFCRTDQERRPVAVRRIRSRPSLVASWLRLIWLCDRQMRRLALGVLAFSLGLGVLFLVVGPLLWPIATLFLGIVCGVNVYSDEQANGSFRYLGEQRLPLGRLWFFKTATRFALLLFASFLVLLPSLLVALYNSPEKPSGHREIFVIAQTMHLDLMVEVVPLGPYLLLSLLYGFSAGQLCGLLSRKSIVAGMIALMASAGLAFVWLPPMAGIGLHFWQIAVPPLILLIASALFVRAWAADRLASSRTYIGVSAAVVASLLWIAFGLWYRVAEIPDVPEPFNVAEYIASLPAMDKDEAGQLIRSSARRIEATVRDVNASMYKQDPSGLVIQRILNDGWPEGKSELGEALDKAFADDWLRELSPLPDLPTGMVINQRLMSRHSPELGRWWWASDLSRILIVRGLQQQARGDPAIFVDHMRIALAWSRNFQHHMPSFLSGGGERAATEWSSAVDLWLRKLKGRPDLLRSALQVLIDHEAKLPDRSESEKADYLIDWNTLTGAPEELLKNVMPQPGKNEKDEFREAQRQFTVMLWMFPWEQTRHKRILRVAYSGTDIERNTIREWGGRVFETLGSSVRIGSRSERIQRTVFLRNLASLHACQLRVALRLYQEENGELPETLDALVPRYLKSIPRDPFSDGMPFRYRRSRGDEWLIWSQWVESNQQPGTADIPAEVFVMPRADEPLAPPKQALPAVPMGVMMNQGQQPLPEAVPLMPGADVPAVPPPVIKIPPGIAAGGGPREVRFIPAGQGILWSVGEDGQDDGGKQVTTNLSNVGQDLIFLVPPPPPH